MGHPVPFLSNGRVCSVGDVPDDECVLDEAGRPECQRAGEEGERGEADGDHHERLVHYQVLQVLCVCGPRRRVLMQDDLDYIQGGPTEFNTGY